MDLSLKVWKKTNIRQMDWDHEAALYYRSGPKCCGATWVGIKVALADGEMISRFEGSLKLPQLGHCHLKLSSLAWSLGVDCLFLSRIESWRWWRGGRWPFKHHQGSTGWIVEKFKMFHMAKKLNWGFSNYVKWSEAKLGVTLSARRKPG